MLPQKKFVVSFAVAAGLVASAAGFAQSAVQTTPPAVPAAKSPTQTPPPAGPAPARQPGAIGRGQGRETRTSALKLTDAQRNQIRALREAQRKDSQALRDKMRTARQQLQQAMRADVPDEAAVRSAAGAVAAVRADQAALQARARGQFMKVLTPEQQARMKQTRARATQRAMRARRAMRAERWLMRRNQMMRQQYDRWWRGWI
jgi:Spy/CpxP family protein refolding chaperone